MDCIDHLPVLSDTKTPYCSFGCVIINWNIAVCEKYTEIFFLIQRIADSIAKFILFGHGYSFKVWCLSETEGIALITTF